MDMNIHNVVKVELTEIKERECMDKPYYTRKLYVTDSKGNELELTLFTDNAENIRLIREL